MQCGPRLARKLHCRGLEEKHDLFLAAPVTLAGPPERTGAAPSLAAPTVGAGQSFANCHHESQGYSKVTLGVILSGFKPLTHT